jgi:hypothetical protein
MVKLPRAVPKVMGVPVSIETLKGLTKASKDVFMRRFVDDDVRQIRQDICMVCPSWEHTSNRCLECGCQMRIKARLSSSSCPLGKWYAQGPDLNLGDASIDAPEHEERAEHTSD